MIFKQFQYRLWFGPLIIILSIVYSSLTSSATIGAIMMFIVGVIAISSSSKIFFVIGTGAAISSIALMSILSIYSFDRYSDVKDIVACAAFSSNSSIKSLPSTTTYQQLAIYGVYFYGEESMFSQSGRCEIDNYSSSIECFCVDRSNNCQDISYGVSCRRLVSDLYLGTVEASFIITLVSIVVLAGYIAMSLHAIFQPPDSSYHAPSMVEATAGVPTIATVIKPFYLSDEPSSITEEFHSNHSDQYNSFFGRVSLSRQGSNHSRTEPEAVPVPQ